MDPMSDLDNRLKQALLVEPSPEMLVRIRTRVAAEQPPVRTPLAVSFLAVASVVLVALIGAALPSLMTRGENSDAARSSGALDEALRPSGWLPLREAVVMTPPNMPRALAPVSPRRQIPNERVASGAAGTAPGFGGAVLVSASEMAALQRLFRGEYAVAVPEASSDVPADRLVIPEIEIEPITVVTFSQGEKQ